jgi:hypothetical protein
MFHWFNFSNTKWYKVHIAQATLIYTPSTKPTCHENYNAKNNYTSVSQIILSCAVKLKYDILTNTHTYIYINIFCGWASAMFWRMDHTHCLRLLGDLWYSMRIISGNCCLNTAHTSKNINACKTFTRKLWRSKCTWKNKTQTFGNLVIVIWIGLNGTRVWNKVGLCCI